MSGAVTEDARALRALLDAKLSSGAPVTLEFWFTYNGPSRRKRLASVYCAHGKVSVEYDDRALGAEIELAGAYYPAAGRGLRPDDGPDFVRAMVLRYVHSSVVSITVA